MGKLRYTGLQSEVGPWCWPGILEAAGSTGLWEKLRRQGLLPFTLCLTLTSHLLVYFL